MNCSGRRRQTLLPFLQMLSLLLLHESSPLQYGSYKDVFSGGSPRKRSLSDLLSSPELYAAALNMSVPEIRDKKMAHLQASQKLHSSLASASVDPKERHRLICEHRFRWGRHPFTCNKCWSYSPICVCELAGTRRLLPPQISVAVWTHHKEWGLTSNTGSLLSITLTPVKMLMKGLPAHDKWLNQVVGTSPTEKSIPVVLWPTAPSSDDQSTQGNSMITVTEIRDFLADDEKNEVVIIAVDGTWRNARRMVSKLPAHVRRLELGYDSAFPRAQPKDEPVSLLAPLRKRKGGLKNGVCTVEAVVAALLSLGLSAQDADHVLDVARSKVDRTKRYRGKVDGSRLEGAP